MKSKSSPCLDLVLAFRQETFAMQVSPMSTIKRASADYAKLRMSFVSLLPHTSLTCVLGSMDRRSLPLPGARDSPILLAIACV